MGEGNETEKRTRKKSSAAFCILAKRLAKLVGALYPKGSYIPGFGKTVLIQTQDLRSGDLEGSATCLR